MQTTLNPAHLRQPGTLCLPVLSSAAEVAKFATPQTVKAWTAFDTEVNAHNAAVKSFMAQIKDIANGNVDANATAELPAKLMATRLALATAAVKLKTQRQEMLETLKADFTAHQAARKADLDAAAKAAEPKAKEVFPDNPSQVQNAVNSMCRKEIEAWQWTPHFYRYDDENWQAGRFATVGVTKFALAQAVLDAAGVSAIVALPDRADI